MTTFMTRLLGVAVLTVMAYGTGLAGGARGVATGPGAERLGL